MVYWGARAHVSVGCATGTFRALGESIELLGGAWGSSRSEERTKSASRTFEKSMVNGVWVEGSAQTYTNVHAATEIAVESSNAYQTKKVNVRK